MGSVRERKEGEPAGRRDFLRVIGTGAIGQDPAYGQFKRSDGSNSSYLRLRVGSNGVQKDRVYTEWYDVVVFGPRADALAGVLAKGDTIAFEGEWRSRERVDNRFFAKNASGNIDPAKPASYPQISVHIGQTGNISLMKRANGERRTAAELAGKAAPAASGGNATELLQNLIGQIGAEDLLKILLAGKTTSTLAADPTTAPDPPPIEEDIPF